MLNKKIVASLIAMSATMFAHATDLTILNTGSKTGGFFVQTNAYHQDFSKSMKAEFVNPGQYCAAYAILQKTKDPVLFPWASDFEAAGRSGEGCAKIPLVESEIVSYTRDTYRVCSAKPEMTKERFIKAGEAARVGYSTPAFAFEASVQAVNKSFGTKHVGVTYEGGGGSVKTALINKEVDYVISMPKFALEAVAAGQAKCFWTMGKETLDGMEALAVKDLSNKKLIMGSDTVWLLRNATPAMKTKVDAEFRKIHGDDKSAITKALNGINQHNFNKPVKDILADWEDSVNILKK